MEGKGEIDQSFWSEYCSRTCTVCLNKQSCNIIIVYLFCNVPRESHAIYIPYISLVSKWTAFPKAQNPFSYSSLFTDLSSFSPYFPRNITIFVGKPKKEQYCVLNDRGNWDTFGRKPDGRALFKVMHFNLSLKKISFLATSLKTYHGQHTNQENLSKWIHLNAIFIAYDKTHSVELVSLKYRWLVKKKKYHYESFNHVLLLCCIIPAL